MFILHVQATVLSSQRAFLRRIDAVDLGNPNKKGDPITLFLFSDSVEVLTYVQRNTYVQCMHMYMHGVPEAYKIF